MKTEIEEQINATIDRELGMGLTDLEISTVRALCRAAYSMGFDHGKSIKPTLELVGADSLIEALNKS